MKNRSKRGGLAQPAVSTFHETMGRKESNRVWFQEQPDGQQSRSASSKRVKHTTGPWRKDGVVSKVEETGSLNGEKLPLDPYLLSPKKMSPKGLESDLNMKSK